MIEVMGDSSQNWTAGGRNRLVAHTQMATVAPLMNTQKATPIARYSEYSSIETV